MKTERSSRRNRENILEFVDLDPGEIDAGAFSEQERSVLDTINQHVAAGESLDAIMTFLFESTRAMFPCDRMGLAFLEEAGTRVVAYWSKAEYELMLLEKGYAEDLQGSSLEAVFERGSIRIINDLDAYLKSKPISASTALLVREGVRSNMTCPLTVGGRRVGFLFRSSRALFAYDRHQACLQAAMVERLAQAVEKAYRIEQLESANDAYRELLAFVSHEVKSPIASIAMDARVLAEAYLGELSTQQRRKVQRIIAKAEHVLLLARDYLDLTRIDTLSPDPQFREVPDFVAEVVEPAIEIGGAQLEDRNMWLTRELPASLLHVSCEPELLRIAVGNLVSNAVKYGKEGGEVRVKVERSNLGIRVCVWNEGVGFPANGRSRLFSRFQTAELRHVPGTGIGLYSVWRIAKLHGGRVDAESDEGHWAEFSLEIPQPPGSVDRKTMETLLS
jgi:signal transduction histidine kinase